MKSDPQTIQLLLLGVLVLALLGIWQYVGGSARQRDIEARSANINESDSALKRLIARLDRWFARTRPGRAIGVRLSAGGVSATPLQFVGACLAAYLGTAVATRLVFPAWLGYFFGLIAVVFCINWLERRREQRIVKFVGQLSEISRILANGASAGLSLAGAIEHAAGEIEDPAGDELGRVANEMRLGRSLDDALEMLQQRMPSREVAVLMTTLVIQQRSGGDTVRALHDLGEALQARRETLREVRTILAGSVFSSWLVGGLMVGTLLLLNSFNPEIMNKMTTSPIGIIALVTSGTLYLIGMLLIRKTTRIEL